MHFNDTTKGNFSKVISHGMMEFFSVNRPTLIPRDRFEDWRSKDALQRLHHTDAAGRAGAVDTHELDFPRAERSHNFPAVLLEQNQ